MLHSKKEIEIYCFSYSVEKSDCIASLNIFKERFVISSSFYLDNSRKEIYEIFYISFKQNLTAPPFNFFKLKKSPFTAINPFVWDRNEEFIYDRTSEQICCRLKQPEILKSLGACLVLKVKNSHCKFQVFKNYDPGRTASKNFARGFSLSQSLKRYRAGPRDHHYQGHTKRIGRTVILCPESAIYENCILDIIYI